MGPDADSRRPSGPRTLCLRYGNPTKKDSGKSEIEWAATVGFTRRRAMTLYPAVPNVLDFWKMKRLLIGSLVLASAVLGLWLTVVRVPVGNSLHAWHRASGTLVVPAGGVALLPRWKYRQTPSKPLNFAGSVHSQEGMEIDVTVDFTTGEGRYSLDAADEPAAGFSAVAERVLQIACSRVSIDCLIGERPEEDCPEDLGRDLARELASKIGARPDQIEVEAAPNPSSLRQAAIRQIEQGLPPPRQKVLVLGLDGLEWKLIMPWIQEGRLPNIQRLMRAGAWGVMDTIEPMLSPLIWTSMATGFPPEIHGILDFVEIDSTTEEYRPITGRNRRVPALWNIASAFSRNASVIGWWATWPAEHVNGVMVSDRLYYTLTSDIDPSVFRNDPPQMVFPATETAKFAAIRDRSVREADWQRVRAFMDVSQPTFRQAVESERGLADPVDGFRRILAATSTYFGSALEVAGTTPDLFMVYIQATDEINHVLAPFVAPPVAEVSEQDAAIYAAAVPPYFEHVDQWIGRLLETCPLSDYSILLVSDHGTRWGADRPRGLTKSDARTAVYWHSPDAVFVIAGKGVAKVGAVDRRYSIYDVAPTVMTLLGLPSGVGWIGRLLPGVSEVGIEAVDYRSLLPAVSYRSASAGEAPVDREYIAKLRALGYLGAEAEPPSSRIPVDPTGDQPPSEIGARENPSRLNNLGVLFLEQKNYDEAERNFRAAIDANRDYAAPHNNLRRLYMETGRWDDADRELWVAVEKGSTIAESRVVEAAAQYEENGELDRSEAILRGGAARFPENAVFWIKMMGLKMDRGRCLEALDAGREATERFPDNSRLHAYYGFAAVCAGDYAKGRSALVRSLEIDPRQPEIREAVARLPAGPAG